MKKKEQSKTRILLLGVVVAMLCLLTSAFDFETGPVAHAISAKELKQPEDAELMKMESALKLEKLALSKKLAAGRLEKIRRNITDTGNSTATADVNNSHGISEKDYIVVF